MPLFERLLEVPLDIYEGIGNGRMFIKSYDTASWRFPDIFGNIRVKGIFKWKNEYNRILLKYSLSSI